MAMLNMIKVLLVLCFVLTLTSCSRESRDTDDKIVLRSPDYYCKEFKRSNPYVPYRSVGKVIDIQYKCVFIIDKREFAKDANKQSDLKSLLN